MELFVWLFVYRSVVLSDIWYPFERCFHPNPISGSLSCRSALCTGLAAGALKYYDYIHSKTLRRKSLFPPFHAVDVDGLTTHTHLLYNTISGRHMWSLGTCNICTFPYSAGFHLEEKFSQEFHITNLHRTESLRDRTLVYSHTMIVRPTTTKDGTRRRRWYHLISHRQKRYNKSIDRNEQKKECKNEGRKAIKQSINNFNLITNAIRFTACCESSIDEMLFAFAAESP